ncbi:MAG TPA: HupE/UreJ family protein [Burkholderiales bacterium]|nr:HupE/UreJ family protein [Burkholderiales bacterium]
MASQRLRILLALLTAASCLLAATGAWAHATQLSSSRAEVRGNRIDVQLELNARDVEVALGVALLGSDGEIAPGALGPVEESLAAYLLERAKLSNSAGAACQGRLAGVHPKAEHVLVDMLWTCPPMTGQLVYSVTLFQEIDPAARHMVTASGDVRRMALLSTSNPSVALSDTRPHVGEVMWHYLLAGIEHIAIGYDHIAFLVAVILWGRRLWPLVGVVTAFTIAHSITLSLAVLDVARLPSQLVETAIALSIVYVAAENFFVRDLRRRAWITFAFGLVHGFGFASVLRDYGIPRDALVPALAAFNVGVEVGQIAIVVVALGAMRGLERALRGAFPAFPGAYPYAVSASVLLLGLYWTVERLLPGA